MSIIDIWNKLRNRKNVEPNKLEDVVIKLRTWLGQDGISFFRKVKEKYGRIDAIWTEGEFEEPSIKHESDYPKLPHVVHFREGMQVRNFLRGIYGTTWTDHDYDNRWIGLVEEAIKET